MQRIDGNTALDTTLEVTQQVAARAALRVPHSDRVEVAPAPRPEEIFALVYRQMRKLAGPRDVEELTQIAVEQVLRALPRFEGRSQLSTWTFRICYLTVRKHDRWYRRWLRRFTLTADGELPEPTSSPASARGDERVERKQRAARLHVALELLSPKQRAAVVMHDMEGLSIDEIAQIVGAEPVAVRSRLRDGRRMLAKALADDPYFGDEPCRQEAPR